MRVSKIVLIAALIVTAVIGLAFAMKHEASVDQGKALFNDPKLGTTGTACGNCHTDGKGLENAGARSDLANVINGCITRALKGKALDEDSFEMQSMVMYIKSLGRKKSRVPGY